jgi:hypothetical protein
MTKPPFQASKLSNGASIDRDYGAPYDQEQGGSPWRPDLGRLAAPGSMN